ncbi:RDD family protein [Caballeronia sp. SBC2]|uniref:RDD family protein n=1 Tax=Caballeronia sp. SBC2 TaxID=2705547 RepID=UPI0013E0EBB3|nr:RDD family protein [Caballeronia sp. SBC2]QIE22934.1 hypothetical protein SBC2_09470 [Caballeronia sp. SBC2]
MSSSVYADTSAINDQNLAARPAGPWTRYWVRTLDLSACTYACLAAVYIIIKSSGPASPLWSHPFAVLFGLFALTPAALSLDALVYAVFGNTLSRATMGIKVLTMTGEKLTSEQYFRRNMAMWGPGYAFGIPVIYIVTFVLSFIKLRDTGYTSWDSKSNYEVRVMGRLVSSYFLTFGVWFCVQFSIGLAIGGWLALQPSPSAYGPSVSERAVATTPVAVPPSMPARRTARWLNPNSKMEATLPEGWTVALSKPEQQYWWLSKGPRGPVVDVQFWPLNGKTPEPLGDYAEGLRRTGTGPWALIGSGKIEWEGRAVWQGEETAPGVKGAGEGETVYSMTRFFEGDGGVWVVSYSGPESIATHAEGLAVGRAILAVTLHG